MVLNEAASHRLLGLELNATAADIRAAYHRLARRFHPDLGGDEARFKEITAAYAVLNGRTGPLHAAPSRGPARLKRTSRARSREDHTKAWAAWRARAETFGGSATNGVGPDPVTLEHGDQTDAPTPNPFSVNGPTAATDALNTTPSLGRRILDRVRARWSELHSAPVASLDRTLRLPVSVETCLHGGRTHLAIHRAVACPSCEGTRRVCTVCEGARRIEVRETVRVTVPAGVLADVRLRLVGKGDAGLDGEADGDLFLVVSPDLPVHLHREGADLAGRVRISAAVLRDGGVVTVQGAQGPLKLRVPAGSRAGLRLRLPGQGLPHGAGVRGDLRLTLAEGGR